MKKTQSSKSSSGAFNSSYASKYKHKNSAQFGSKSSFLNGLAQSSHGSPVGKEKNQEMQGSKYPSTIKGIEHTANRNQYRKQSDQSDADFWLGNLGINDRQTSGKGVSEVNFEQFRRGNHQMVKQQEQNSVADNEAFKKTPTVNQIETQEEDVLIEEEIQEDLNMLQQYRELQRQYLQQLQAIREETEKIKKECDIEKSRIAESEHNLLKKKNKLSSLQESYQLIVGSITAKQGKKKDKNTIQSYQQKIIELKQQYDTTKQRNNEEARVLQLEYDNVVKENESLSKQLSEMEAELENYEKEMSEKAFEAKMNKLKDEEKELLETVTKLQGKENELKAELKQIEASKPVSSELHKKYLELYEKVFITTQIQKAQQILKMKDNERKQLEEFQKRKAWIKEKKVEISLRQKRVNEKNKQIDKLTEEIRQKSTELLELYQKM